MVKSFFFHDAHGPRTVVNKTINPEYKSSTQNDVTLGWWEPAMASTKWKEFQDQE